MPDEQFKPPQGPPLPNIPPVEPPTQKEHAEALETHGQRAINHMWELVQATIAVGVMITNMTLAIAQTFGYSKGAIPAFVSEAMFIIITFYFTRTNHSLTGGVGNKKDKER